MKGTMFSEEQIIGLLKEAYSVEAAALPARVLIPVVKFPV